MSKWIKFQGLTKRVTTWMDATHAHKLKVYAKNEGVSQGRIIQTLLDNDKGFRQTAIPEQGAYANTQKDDDKDSSKAK